MILGAGKGVREVTTAALFGFLGVLVGSVITAAITLKREQLITKRERDTREELRLREHGERGATLEYESLLALQDAMNDMFTVLDERRKAKLAYKEQTGRWQEREPGQPLPQDYRAVYGRLGSLRARIFDEIIRDLIGEFRNTSIDFLQAKSLDDMEEALLKLDQMVDPIEQQVALLLPRLLSGELNPIREISPTLRPFLTATRKLVRMK